MAFKDWDSFAFTVHLPDGTTIVAIMSGRKLWTNVYLIAAGEKWCTPIHPQGPRWSGCVFRHCPLKTSQRRIAGLSMAHIRGTY